MKTRPILFSVPMIRALLEGRKTQTRRALKNPSLWATDVQLQCAQISPRQCSELAAKHCPYGVIEDRLWVRESWRVGKRWDSTAPRNLPIRGLTVMFATGGSAANDDHGQYVLDESYPKTLPDWAGKVRPGMFMPRWASRLTLRVSDVRIERLQEIEESDAEAEGAETAWGNVGADERPTYVAGFRRVWEEINGKGSWEANPWVWALSFTVEKRNVDDVLKEAA